MENSEEEFIYEKLGNSHDYQILRFSILNINNRGNLYSSIYRNIIKDYGRNNIDNIVPLCKFFKLDEQLKHTPYNIILFGIELGSHALIDWAIRDKTQKITKYDMSQAISNQDVSFVLWLKSRGGELIYDIDSNNNSLYEAYIYNNKGVAKMLYEEGCRSNKIPIVEDSDMLMLSMDIKHSENISYPYHKKDCNCNKCITIGAANSLLIIPTSK